MTRTTHYTYQQEVYRLLDHQRLKQRKGRKILLKNNGLHIWNQHTSLMTSLITCFAASICSGVPSMCIFLSFVVSPGGRCKGITCRGHNYQQHSAKHLPQLSQSNWTKYYNLHRYTWIRAPVLACIFFIVSPPLPMTSPTWKDEGRDLWDTKQVD